MSLWLLIAFWVLCGCAGSQEDTRPEALGNRLYEQGMEAFHTGQWATAVDCFQRALRLAPDHVQAQIRLGELYLRLGHREAARQFLEHLPAEALNCPEARVLQARILAAEGRSLQAWEIGAQVLQQQPRSLDARLLLAQLSLQATATMDLRGAQALCQEILRQFPDHYEAGVMLLKAALGLGEFRAALELGEQFAQTYPEDRTAQLLRGTAALWARDPGAVPILERAVDLSLSYRADRLKSLWLLKLAFDQQGGYPADLADRYRFYTAYSPSPSAPLRFTDIAARAGVDKLDRGRGSAWLDFDGDGDLDLFSVGIHVVHALFRNDGGERFQDVAAAQGLADPRGGWSASCADFDNDGDPDLYVTRDAWEGAAPNSLYRNDGDRFLDVAPAAGAADSSSSFTATWGDFDLDGYLDLYVANGVVGDGGKNRLLRNQRNGTFIEVASQAGVADSGRTIGTAFGDYDGDRFPDLYVVDIGSANRLYHNDRDGTFTDLAPQAGVTFPIDGGYVTFFFDYDNDGHLDLFAATMSSFEDVLNSMVTGQAIEPNRPFLYHNDGDGTFTDVTIPAGLARSFGSMGIGVGDVNSDGFPDIYLANGGPEMYRLEPNTLFLNQGDGTFADVTETAGVGNLGKGHGATFADFDGDGDLDLYAGLGGHYDGDVWPNSLYRNDGEGGHYLEVEIVGTTSNRDGIGARVSAYCGSHQVHAEVASGYGFGSSNALSLHLGLGAYRWVDRLVIHWPSGVRQTWEGIPVDCTVRLTEGQDHYAVIRRRP